MTITRLIRPAICLIKTFKSTFCSLQYFHELYVHAPLPGAGRLGPNVGLGRLLACAAPCSSGGGATLSGISLLNSPRLAGSREPHRMKERIKRRAFRSGQSFSSLTYSSGCTLHRIRAFTIRTSHRLNMVRKFRVNLLGTHLLRLPQSIHLSRPTPCLILSNCLIRS